MTEKVAASRRRDIIETITIGTATDGQLFDELLRRCHYRLEQNLTARADERLRNLLYDVGKLLIQRGLKD